MRLAAEEWREALFPSGEGYRTSLNKLETRGVNAVNGGPSESLRLRPLRLQESAELNLDLDLSLLRLLGLAWDKARFGAPGLGGYEGLIFEHPA